MFPMELDHQILKSLPLPNEQGVRSVLHVLESILAQRIVPYFRNHRGSDLIQLARVKQNLGIYRMEDEDGEVRMVSVLTKTDHGWAVGIHERLFDYIAFVVPLKPEFVIGDGTVEERKVIAYVEMLLRHHVEHLMYPERTEQEIVRSDADFAMAWHRDDPTSYRMLRNALADEMNGVKGAGYLELLDHAEQGKSLDCAIKGIVRRYVSLLADLPERWLKELLPALDRSVKARVVGECYRRSRSTSFSLVNRASHFRKIMEIFGTLVRRSESEALEIFSAFRDKWGAAGLLHDMDLPESALEGKSASELFDLFRENLSRITGEFERPMNAPIPRTPPAARSTVSSQPPKSLKERIEDARNDPSIPRQVMDLIEKNRMNASGQSGAKYTELIETLLAVPWGKINRITVSPGDFERGLNKSHYGLKKPKEIIYDFFANLIWRYRNFNERDIRSWQHSGSAFLLVGAPGVGKTSLAISIARNLGIPYHKISLGGMKDEADIRGYGFTYEGSKPGPIVQGLIKMGVMNGMFILDEADKTEKFAIATLLEILDPEQNHLFHDKYFQSTVDLDISNCHFFLTANTLDTVPAPILNRCEVIFLDRYSVEEKISIARHHLVGRVMQKYMIGPDEIFFDADEEENLLRYLIRNYTLEAGVRDLERTIRTLFLRIQRKEILGRGRQFVRITREKIRDCLEEPSRPRQINEEDRVGEMMGLGVNMEFGTGSLIPIQATTVGRSEERAERSRGYMSMVHATGNIERVMDESRKVASTAIVHLARVLGIDVGRIEEPVHLHFMGGSTKKDGPSAGGAIALALASLFLGRKIRRDVTMTGEIDTQGRITGVGGLGVKLETAYGAGVKTMIIPRENLYGLGGIERLPEALKKELQILTYDEWKGRHQPFDYTMHMLQVVAVENIQQAVDIAFIDQAELDAVQGAFAAHAERAVQSAARSVMPVRCLRIVLLDEAEDLDTGLLQPVGCEANLGSVVLVRSEIKDKVLARLAGEEGNISVREFDPSRERLGEVIREIRAGLPPPMYPLRLSVVAPLYFLERDGIRPDEFFPDPSLESLRIFATSCTVENVQIEFCRTVLNRVFRELTHLSPAVLEDCPFLSRKNGIYTLTVSFIPEKYRLDGRRAEEILKEGLKKWLMLMGVEYEEILYPSHSERTVIVQPSDGRGGPAAL